MQSYSARKPAELNAAISWMQLVQRCYSAPCSLAQRQSWLQQKHQAVNLQGGN
jgi:hypothetical protein